MNKKIAILLFITIIVFLPKVSADDITMSVNQSTYYFLSGQKAIIPLTINNTYDKQISGQLTYTITQQVNQGGNYYSSSNTQTTSFQANEGNYTINLDFGTSDTPITLIVNMNFLYTEVTQREVSLKDITIHFVSNQSQMNNQEEKVESSSEEIIQGNQNNQNSQNQQNNQQQNQPQNTEQKIQNNQLSQDSNALKEQMQKEMEEQEQEMKEFEQNLLENSDFQDYHDELLENGYNITDKKLSPTDNNSGDFNLEYENEKGEQATLEGTMNDGKMENIQKQTPEDRKNMLESLNQSEQFQDFKKQLENDGFNQTDIQFSQDGNNTEVNINYQNNENQTASIKAEFENGELQEVELEREQSINHLFWIIPLIILILSGFVYIYFYKIRKKFDIQGEKIVNIEKPFDYISEAKKLLEKAKGDFESKKYKDAYGRAGQSLRLFLSYHNGLNKEITNDDVVKYLKRNKRPYSKIKQCFDLCSLVEFAKYHANQNDFNQIFSTAKEIIENN